MWTSIAAWVVTVASTFVSAEVVLRARRACLIVDFAGGCLCLQTYVYHRPTDTGVGFSKIHVSLDYPLIHRVRLLPYAVRSRDLMVGADCTFVEVPTWYFAVPPTLAFFILHRRERRRRAHRLKHTLCTRCGYSRAGIAEGAKCPECGS